MSLTCDFEPSICKSTEEKPAKYSGKIKLKPLAYEERLELIEAQAMIQAEAKDDEAKSMALLKAIRMFSKNQLQEFFVSSTLTRIDDGYVFDTLEKIKYDGPASSCIPEISSALMSGELSLGK